jgi:hypothetical protein
MHDGGVNLLCLAALQLLLRMLVALLASVR